MIRPKPLILIILDGWGIRAPENGGDEGNAIRIAKTPVLDELFCKWPNTRLACSGEAVGLPRGIMGNSEVGHMNIGAGRVVYQDLLRIDMAVRSGSFRENRALKTVMEKVRSEKSTLHLMGLVSDGGVHSRINHLFALLEMAGGLGLERIAVHAIMDGRDTPPDAGIDYIRNLEDFIRSRGVGNIATLCGRYYAMDRDNRWDRVEKAYRLYTRGEGIEETDPVTAMAHAYARKETDEFIKPIRIAVEDDPDLSIVKDGDALIFFNFRADRAREITRAFTEKDFSAFDRQAMPDLSGYACMTLYDETFKLPVAFPPVRMNDILGEVLSNAGLSQLRIAETEKYAHVTYFFNGGNETPFPGEDRALIPSPREVATYDEKPEMSARELTEEVLDRIRSEKYDFIVLNFANMDMVGHTGVLDAAVRACEVVDECVGRIVKEVGNRGGVSIVTADHGNAETMKDENGNIHTAHTLNPVPFILLDEKRKDRKMPEGILGDIAPTILKILGVGQPEKMAGTPLVDP